MLFDKDYTYLFLDKFAGNHIFNNKLTQNITMESIEKNISSYKILSGKDAYKKFNDIFLEFWTLDHKMDNIYNLYFLEDLTSDIPIYITIVGIDNTIFRNYIDEFWNFPDKNFFTLLAHYHIQYTNNQNMCNKNIEIIYNDIIKAIDNTTYNNKIKFKKFEGINVELFEYQKKTISWMYKKEIHETQIQLCINNMIVIDDSILVNTMTDKILPIDETKLTIRGGGLIDEMGLGKTIQMTTLAYINPFKNECIDKTNKKLYSKATLIICPNTLCGQWKREIEKAINMHGKLNIISILTKVHFNKYTYLDILNADFVIMPLNFLDNKVFINKIYCNNIDAHTIEFGIDSEINKLFLSDDFDIPDVNLLAINWHRLVVDEFHEIYSVKPRSMIKELMKYFKSTYRWCMSGTPFDISQKSFDHIIRFLAKYPNLDTDLLKQKSVISYLSRDCFRRNTKDSVENECKLPDIIDNVIWLKFTATERMMYNAYLANHNNTKDDIFLRKLCCHPKLADEIKLTLLNCKTLEEIEVTMLKHYKEQMEIAENLVNTIKERITKTKKKIKDIKKKQKKNKTIYINKIFEKLGVDTDPNLITNAATLLDNLDEFLKRQETKLPEAITTYEGKKSTYTFFNNVIEKIRNKTNSTDDDICGICLGEIPEDNIGVSVCGHVFCYECLKLSFKTSPKCPYCNKKLLEKDIFMISYNKNKIEKNNNTDKLIDKVGTKIGNVIEYLKKNDRNVVIFSQWDDLLKKIGGIMKDNGIDNVFCSGNVYQRDKIIRQFDNSDIKVIMLSSENAASGTNLTKASEIILLDPVYGTKETRINIENQAIGRIHRIGQTNNIKVTRFIIKDSIENDIYESNK